jgi:hypothetical protein
LLSLLLQLYLSIKEKMSTEPTTTKPEETNVATETQETPVEAPVATEAPAEAAATEQETPAKTEAAAEKPNPTPSRSTKRLSILYNKAKKTVTDKLSNEKKPAEKAAEKPAEAKPEPVSEEPAAIEETAAAPAAETPAAAEPSEVKTPKSEKRKSFIDTLFRSKVNYLFSFLFSFVFIFVEKKKFFCIKVGSKKPPPLITKRVYYQQGWCDLSTSEPRPF